MTTGLQIVKNYEDGAKIFLSTKTGRQIVKHHEDIFVSQFFFFLKPKLKSSRRNSHPIYIPYIGEEAKYYFARKLQVQTNKFLRLRIQHHL